MNGFAIIDKPSGITSSDVVIKCRNSLSKAVGCKIKCGHMGTLDPMASGILIVAFGKATRLFDYMLAKVKKYTATFVFGEERDTVDATGNVVKCTQLPKYSEITDFLPNLIGEIMQTPPKFSAVNVNGRRAYDLARAGKDFEISAKKVNIFAIEILDKVLSGQLCCQLKVSVSCGGGTYIRSICADLAESCESSAYMSELVRDGCAGFDLSDAVSLEQFMAKPLDNVRDIGELLSQIAPIVDIDGEQYAKLKNGVAVESSFEDGLYGAYYRQKARFIIKVDGGKAKSVCFLDDNTNE